MNRNQLTEVISSHLRQAGENKKERDKEYYQRNKEVLKAKQKERREKKKTESKKPSTNGETNEQKKYSVNVDAKNVQSEKERIRKRKWITEQRAQAEGLNFGAPLTERTDQDFLNAKRLIAWLEETKNKEGKFPREWLKKRLAQEPEEFWNAFSELLKNNRAQYREIKKLRLPLTVKALHQWQIEKSQVSKKTIQTSQKPKGVRRFLYEIVNNRLWYQGQEVKTKTLTQWGRFRFVVENNPTTNSYFFLEPQLERDWQLRVYGQETNNGELHHFRTFGSYQDTQIVNFAIQEWDEIIKNSTGKWEKKWNSSKDYLPLLSKGERKAFLS